MTVAERQRRHRDKVKRDSTLVRLKSPDAAEIDNAHLRVTDAASSAKAYAYAPPIQHYRLMPQTQPMPDAAVIQDCFRKAIGKSRLKIPEIEYCERIAKVISAYLRMLRPPIGNTRLTKSALKHAKGFLHHTVGSSDQIKYMARLSYYQEIPNKENQDLIVGLPALETAQQSLRSLLDLYRKRPQPFGWKDMAEALLNIGMNAWREGHHPDERVVPIPPDVLFGPEVRYPKSVNSGDPLCLLVWHVLNAVGIKRSPSTISAVLRQRRSCP